MGISEFDIALRLVLASILGGLIGLERESLERPAGLRTHILVCAGSSLIMLVSMVAFSGFDGPKDPGRIAAQVISGIGFLGAGTIIREGVSVRGLTTAASLWVVAGIGLAVGGGMFFAAVVATALVFLTLVFFGHLERQYLINKNTHRIKLIVADKPGAMGQIALFFGQKGISIRNITMHHRSYDNKMDVEFILKIPNELDILTIIQLLGDVPGVYAIDRLI
ncbi:MAG: sapB [Firmicutes bacterium]|nr:sapB [Bacillota bacterium]